MNFYRYTFNNPTFTQDPLGLWSLVGGWGRFQPAPKFRPYTPLAPNTNDFNPAPKKISSRVEALIRINEESTQLETQIQSLEHSKCQKDIILRKQLLKRKMELFDQMLEELNIFNNLSEPGLSA